MTEKRFLQEKIVNKPAKADALPPSYRGCTALIQNTVGSLSEVF